MKQYPKMSNADNVPLGEHCVAFKKYDGSNVRAGWSMKRGFHKFGSRNQIMDETHSMLGEAVTLFTAEYADQIAPILEENFPKDQVVLFFEFYGEHSFAGAHKQEPKQLTLIDAYIGKTMINPSLFTELFYPLPFMAEVVAFGILTEEDIEKFRQNTSLNEGVVIKGKDNPWVCKVKTNAYQERLKAKYKGDWSKYWE